MRLFERAAIAVCIFCVVGGLVLFGLLASGVVLR